MMSIKVPFELTSKIESIVYHADRCIQNMEHCCKLLAEQMKLMDYQIKNERTKIILTLSKHGSKARFVEKFERAKTKFRQERDALLKSTEELEQILETGKCECDVCNGMGTLTKTGYQRERGVVHTFLRPCRCDNCDGEGRVTIPLEAEIYLSPFIQMSNRLVQLQTLFSEILEVLKIIAGPRA